MELLDTNWTYPMNPKYEENETISDAEGASISVVADFDYGFFAAGSFEQIATLYYAGYFDPDCTVVKTFDFPCAVSGEFSQDSLYADGREYYALVSDDDYELKIDSLYVTIDEVEEALESIGDGFRIETVVFYNDMMKTEIYEIMDFRFYISEEDRLFRSSIENASVAEFVWGEDSEFDWESEDIYDQISELDDDGVLQFFETNYGRQVTLSEVKEFLEESYGIQFWI